MPSASRRRRFCSTPSPATSFLKNTLTLKPGMVYNREALVERLFSAGYVRRSQVDGPGQFSVRGDIVDIYGPRYAPARPYRNTGTTRSIRWPPSTC